MERLSIRNFGPIVKADVDLKRINVFIGPQGSGKSTIAKVISAFENYNKTNVDWKGYEFKAILREDYGLTGFFEQKTSIRITTRDNKVFDIDDPEEHIMVHEPAARYYTLPKSIYIPAERVIIPLQNILFFLSEKKFPYKNILQILGFYFKMPARILKNKQLIF